MKKIIKSTELPKESEVYLAKDKYCSGGYRVVHPFKIEGKYLWKNIFLGGSQNLFFIIFILLITLLFFYVYTHDTQEMQKVVENPCEYCSTLDMGNYLDRRYEGYDKVKDIKLDINWSNG